MKYILYILLPFVCQSQINDKTLHVYSGLAISVISAEIINQQIDKPFTSAAIGLGLGCLAGITKEVVYDRAMDRGTYSNADMAMTCWGAFVGAVCMRVKFDVCDKQKDKQLEKLEQQKYNNL